MTQVTIQDLLRGDMWCLRACQRQNKEGDQETKMLMPPVLALCFDETNLAFSLTGFSSN